MTKLLYCNGCEEEILSYSEGSPPSVHAFATIAKIDKFEFSLSIQLNTTNIAFCRECQLKAIKEAVVELA